MSLENKIQTQTQQRSCQVANHSVYSDQMAIFFGMKNCYKIYFSVDLWYIDLQVTQRWVQADGIINFMY